jgi:hypothetical protein
MNCRDLRNVADSFLSEELPAEANDEVLQHLEFCASCRADIESGRQLRDAVRAAFNRAPGLRPSNEFRERLRKQLRDDATKRGRFAGLSWRRLAIAAGIMLAAGLSVAVLLERSSASDDAQAHDAIGDHRNCALHYRLVRHPVPLEEAAQRFDDAYRVLMAAPPDQISTPGGLVHVLERHSCEYGAHRYGHVVLRYRDRVVSLLVTTTGTRAARSSVTIPRVIGRPLEGLSVVAVNGTRHAVMLVGDLDPRELTQLAGIVSLPLVQQLAGGQPDPSTMTASLFVHPLQPE